MSKPGTAVDDETLPAAPIHRLLQSHFGTSYRCTDEVKEIIVDACKELILLLSSECSEKANLASNGRTSLVTIQSSHLMMALRELEFDRWMPTVAECGEAETNAHVNKKSHSKTASQKRKIGSARGKTLEELKLSQEEKFRLARIKMEQQIEAQKQLQQKQQQSQQESSIGTPLASSSSSSVSISSTTASDRDGHVAKKSRSTIPLNSPSTYGAL